MKQELIELIEAYAAARASSNTRLMQLASADISVFLQKVEVTLSATQEEPVEIEEE